MTATAGASTRQRPTIDALGPYLACGWQLIPLHRPNAVSTLRGGGERKDGKRPLHKNWTTRAYDSESVSRDAGRDGRNVGVRLRPDQLVVDVDPRNGGNEGLAQLLHDLGVSTDAWPRVETGSGGSHFYLRKPDDLAVLDSLPEYPGVEFKSRGRQVVAAGSVHPDTGRLYEWDDLQPPLADSPEAPAALLELIRRPQPTGATGGGQHTQEEVAAMLDALDPADFRDHDRWLALMMSCHHASSGDARPEFLEWSARDPQYARREGENGGRWDSLHRDRDGAVTYRTLHKFLRDAGREDAIPRPTAEEDFADPVDEADLERFDEGSLQGNDPTRTARLFVDRVRPTLMHHNGEWLAHETDRYVGLEDDTVRQELYRFVGGSFRANRKSVGDAADALRARVHRPREAFAPPCWLEGDGPDPRELLSCRNGLLHLPTMRLLEQTPRFFTRNGLGYDFDPAAPPPERWLSFLAEVWPDEPEMRDLLQEVTGYLLLPDTSLQKMFVWDGPKRAGKGTWGRVLFALVGAANCAGPSLGGFAKDFLLASLVGKQVAVVSDMRVARYLDLGAVAGNLLRITGEDPMTFDRKYKDAWTGTLRTRVVMLTNLGVSIPDVSGALVNRMVPLVSHASFFGREDPALESKLTAELPGILLWAIEGRRRLVERGRFELPAESRDWLDRMADMGSPLPAFLRERCVLERGATTPKAEVYEAWEDWAVMKGVKDKGEPWFARDLMASSSGAVRETRPTVGGQRVQAWSGIRLRDFLDDMAKEDA